MSSLFGRLPVSWPPSARDAAQAGHCGSTRQAGNRSAAHHLSSEDLDDLLSRAGVAKDGRKACAADINRFYDWYDRRLDLNKRNEASQAESLRLVAEAAKELYRRLRKLPSALRMGVEPDYRAFIEKALARHVSGAEVDAERRRAGWPGSGSTMARRSGSTPPGGSACRCRALATPAVAQGIAATGTAPARMHLDRGDRDHREIPI
jgi:hypothetical protein